MGEASSLAQSLQVVSIIFCRERKRAALLSLATVDTEHFDGLGRDVLPTAQEVQAGEEVGEVGCRIGRELLAQAVEQRIEADIAFADGEVGCVVIDDFFE